MHSSFHVFVRAVLVSSVVVVPIVACGGGSSLPADILPDGGVDDATVDAGPGRGVGEPCSDVDRCRTGLACTDGKCAPGHSSDTGTPCTISAECKDGLYCGPQRTCAPAGTGDTGASCASDGDCKSGLRCNLVGLGAVCQPEGTGDVGAQCKVNGDCFGGLACANGACTPLPPGAVAPIAIPSWNGVECKDDQGPVTAYFRVPRNNPEDGDFFRLPFPNDVRRGPDGHPDFAGMPGFPTPGSALLGYDVVQRYLDDVHANADGFSAYTTVTMRFSAEIDFDSLKPQGVVRLVDVTETGPLGDLGLVWAATTGRSAYVCNNSIGIRPRQGEPLEGGHTYAALIMSDAKAKGGGAITQAPDLSALLDATQPGDPVGQHWAKYKPLRDWMTAKSVTKDKIVNAAVFTVAKTIKPTFVTNATPTSSSWTKCDGVNKSPCPDATGDRACPTTPSNDFDEYHALVKLPIYQQGTAPYLDPADGGDFTSSKVRDEDVCLALTMPKGATSAPLVIYAHGTGGSFRSHILEGTALKLAAQSTKIAVMGIDQVQHGPRRNGSTKSPDDLFFNFTNPAAARGNPLQGAADQISLVNFAKSSPNGFTFTKILFWGHSQGATEGAIAATQANLNKGDVGAVVLSGSGASLIDALLTKTSPVNIAAALPFVLNETSGVSDTHPVLSVLQNSIDPADPLNSGRFIDKHVFVPYGQKDTYTPSKVQATFVLASGLGLVQPPAGTTDEAIGSLVAVAPPASGNVSGRTALTREYAPSGYDGHFVAFKNNVASDDVIRFLEAAATSGAAPPVGQ